MGPAPARQTRQLPRQLPSGRPRQEPRAARSSGPNRIVPYAHPSARPIESLLRARLRWPGTGCRRRGRWILPWPRARVSEWLLLAAPNTGTAARWLGGAKCSMRVAEARRPTVAAIPYRPRPAAERPSRWAYLQTAAAMSACRQSQLECLTADLPETSPTSEEVRSGEAAYSRRWAPCSTSTKQHLARRGHRSWRKRPAGRLAFRISGRPQRASGPVRRSSDIRLATSDPTSSVLADAGPLNSTSSINTTVYLAGVHDGAYCLDAVEKVVTSGLRGSATKVRVQPGHALDCTDMITSPVLSVGSYERIAAIRGEPAR